ncbi:PfkB family carbohydrate kinase [Arthrobacter sp. PM3]|uniref:PfkB family carbohydrate kinase n=1 Tax=Arthrobacter sp. PM3 TaxID=2017685 RepID=UPI001ABFE586|nr:PfkB family carbohydrate kinase [Arthrobacter sp. PM3]
MNGTVMVFGSINADASYRMTALPTPGETVIASTASASPGGKGANQAIAAAAAGAVTRMIGMVGDDSEGAAQLAALALRGVDTDSVTTRHGVATGRAVVFVDDSGENSIVVLSGANDLLDGDVAATGLASISTGDVLVLQNEVPAAANRAAARLAQSLGAKVIWNAAPAPTAAADRVHDIDLLVVNEHELKQISGILGIDATGEGPGSSALSALLAECARALDADAICTLGSDGAIFFADGLSGSVAAPKVRAVDTTAAGDTVVGYLAAHAALPMGERLRLAAAAGALAVTRVGASSSIPHIGDVVALPVAPTERTPA